MVAALKLLQDVILSFLRLFYVCHYDAYAVELEGRTFLVSR